MQQSQTNMLHAVLISRAFKIFNGAFISIDTFFFLIRLMLIWFLYSILAKRKEIESDLNWQPQSQIKTY